MRRRFFNRPSPRLACRSRRHPTVDRLNAENWSSFAVAGLMLLVTIAPLPWLAVGPRVGWRHCLAATICVPRLASRLTPWPAVSCDRRDLHLFSHSHWSRIGNRRPRISEIAATLLLVALDSWIMAVWYQLALPIAALAICGRWRASALVLRLLARRERLGCAFTGHPWAFLYQC